MALIAAKKKSSGTRKELPKKKCPVCKKEKSIAKGFYKSASPLYAEEGCVPMCIDCVKDSVINDDGTINLKKLKSVCRKLDKPLYFDALEAAYAQYRREHSYVPEEEIAKQGRDIIALFFKNTASLRQYQNKNYEESEKDGFIIQGNSTSKADKEALLKKYSGAMEFRADTIDIKEDKVEVASEDQETKWTKKDKQNMKYVISTIGYDPYEDIGLVDADRKYCYNILSGYCDTDGISEDGHKMQGVIEMTMLYCQCKKITEAMNIELAKEEPDDAKIQKLTTSKTSLLSSIATIAKDNNIASNYNKNSKQGQSSLTSKMKEMAENGYQEIAVNLFDIKTSEAFRQIDEISNNNIANQLTLDNNEYSEIVKEQREMIQKYDVELEAIKEENRILKNKIIDLENKKR